MFLERTASRTQRKGWVEVICGSMFSGTTEELIRRLRRAEFAKQKVEIFKPGIDTRYDETHVVSHEGTTIRSTPVPSSSNLLLLAGDIEVVGIDEAQFFDDGLPSVCVQLAGQGVRVIIAGLDMDFRGEPFGPMPTFMSRAERVDKLHAICMTCGDEASRTQRLVNGKPARYDDPVVIVGASEMYEARCRVHHEVPR
jgi:thymidine kinase